MQNNNNPKAQKLAETMITTNTEIYGSGWDAYNEMMWDEVGGYPAMPDVPTDMTEEDYELPF